MGNRRKIHDANRNNINRYFELFEEHIAPKSNALIAIVELKRLFQGSMSLEDFHTKVLRLVKEAEYPEGDTWNRVLRDTIISGLASDRIHAKIIKEGKDVTLPRVMEIACTWKFPPKNILTGCRRLPRLTMYNMGKDPREENQNPVEKAQQVVAAVAAVENPPNPVERVGKLHYPQTFVGDVVKEDIRRGNFVKLWKQSVGTVP